MIGRGEADFRPDQSIEEAVWSGRSQAKAIKENHHGDRRSPRDSGFGRIPASVRGVWPTWPGIDQPISQDWEDVTAEPGLTRSFGIREASLCNGPQVSSMFGDHRFLICCPQSSGFLETIILVLAIADPERGAGQAPLGWCVPVFLEAVRSTVMAREKASSIPGSQSMIIFVLKTQSPLGDNVTT